MDSSFHGNTFSVADKRVLEVLPCEHLIEPISKTVVLSTSPKMLLRRTHISNPFGGNISVSARGILFPRRVTTYPRGYNRVSSSLEHCKAADLASRHRPNTNHAGNNLPTATYIVAGTVTTGGQLQNLRSTSHHTHQLRSISSLPHLITSSSWPNPIAAQARQVHSSASPPSMYTTSFAFFEALWEAGITHVFVNLGSDHPSIIEAMVKGQREKKGKFPRIITCPNEVSRSISYSRIIKPL